MNALGAETPSVVVVLGEGLGYLSHWINAAHSGARVIRVFYSEEVFRSSPFSPTAGSTEGRAVADRDTWSPGSGTSAAEFLRTRISELDAEGLRMIEWPPSARLFADRSREANEAMQQVLRELNGSLVTTMSMGRLWLRNSLANFLSFDEILQGVPCAADRIVVIAASGPSLELAAPLLREARDAIDVWALPSSANFLAAAGLKPDLFVMTDPGYWAISHFHHAAPTCPVAMPLSAARGLWELSLPRPFLLAQPGALEGAFLHAMRPVSAPMIAPHGTVAATALDLARAFTKGPIILAGLDMCTNDVISHARPNEFETLFQLQSGRTSPCEGVWYGRSVDQGSMRVKGSASARAPLSLRTYAGWLGQGQRGAGTRQRPEESGMGGSVYRLLPSAVSLPEMIPLDAASLRELVRNSRASSAGPRFTLYSPLGSRAARISAASRVLREWSDCLAEGRAKAEGSDGLGALAAGTVFDLSFHLATRQLLETKRTARLGNAQKARESAIRLLEDCRQFLRALEERMLNAA